MELSGETADLDGCSLRMATGLLEWVNEQILTHDMQLASFLKARQGTQPRT